MSRIDPHSYADLSQGLVRHVHLDLAVDFERRLLVGSVRLHLANAGSGPLDLDSNELVIDRIVDEFGAELAFECAPAEPILGQRLRVHRQAETDQLTVHYATGAHAPALMWLEASQTAGDRPFVLSQCQAIHARSIVPLQDTPQARITYTADLQVPDGLSAVMSAAPGAPAPGPKPGTVTQSFSMPQPIPPYLMALAVGELNHRDLGPRTRVYAQPAVLDAAAWEFAEVEHMLTAAEQLFGPYAWERFDFVVLPPSFPLGGMENPRMTFLTPTLIAGDRSLVAVLAHELAHSWTGNLVTNATNEHFWLNEGWTMYAERRILEALYGTEEATQSAVLGRHALDQVLAERRERGAPTSLYYKQDSIDPDQDFSTLPYEKGFLLITALERSVGRERFQSFVRAYIERFRFTSITTKAFVDFVAEMLPEAADVPLSAWIDEPELPADAPTFHSARLDHIASLAERKQLPSELGRWTTNEKLHYMHHLPDNVVSDDITGLGDALGDARNAEVHGAWLALAAGTAVPSIDAALTEFLATIGRTKLVVPVVRAMVAGERYAKLADVLVLQNLDRLHSSTGAALQALVNG